MLGPVKNGATSIIRRVKIQDIRTAYPKGLLGLASSSAGLIISVHTDVDATPTVYTQAGGTIEGIATLGTYATPTATKCRFKEYDPTNNPGQYELQFDNARYGVTNAKFLYGTVSGAANMAECDFEIPLWADDPYVAKPANFNLFSINGSGQVDVIKQAGVAITSDIVRANTLQAGSTATVIVLDAAASATDNAYLGNRLKLPGLGAGEQRTIVGYVGSTKAATVHQAFIAAPGAIAYEIHYDGVVPASSTDVATAIGAFLDSRGSTIINGISDAAIVNGVLVSSGTGSNQIDVVGGVVRVNLMQVLGTSITETGAGQFAGGASKFFDVVSPTSTMNVITLVTTVTNLTNAPTSIFNLLGTPAGASMSADIAALKADLDSGTSTITTILNQTAPTAIRADLGLAAANLDNQLAALPDAAAINAEVVDALNVDTYAQPGQGDPPATTSMRAMLGYLYKSWRNKKTQDPTTEKVYADDGSTVDHKRTVSDASGTATKGKIGTGP